MKVGAITCEDCGKPYFRMAPGDTIYESGKWCCCWPKQFQQWPTAPMPPGVTFPFHGLTEADVRRIVAEELAKLGGGITSATKEGK